MTTPIWRIKDRSAPPAPPIGFSKILSDAQQAALVIATPRLLVGHGWVKVSGAMATEYNLLEMRLDHLFAFGLPEKQHSVAIATVAE